jgi:hypothetical protein
MGLAAQDAFCEENGLIVIETESMPVAGSWASESSVGGFTGSSYYRWFGADQFNSPGNGTITYLLNITTPGDYQLRMAMNDSGSDNNFDYERVESVSIKPGQNLVIGFDELLNDFEIR